jgi:hypothetical protein
MSVVGSKAPFRPSAHYFRSTPINGHSHGPPACLKRVESRCGAVALGRTYLLPPLSSGGALVIQPSLESAAFARRTPNADATIWHYLRAIHLRVPGAEIDFATARAELMNNWASGLGVRFLTVMTLTEPSTVGTWTGNSLSPTRLALNRATEPGSSPTNLPVAIIVVVN